MQLFSEPVRMVKEQRPLKYEMTLLYEASIVLRNGAVPEQNREMGGNVRLWD